MADLDTDALMRLLYLALLLAGLLFFSLAGGRMHLGRLRDLAIWALIIAMVVIAYASWDTLRSALFPAQAVMLGDAIQLRRGLDGHFHAELEVNGRPVRFMVDTGATDIVLAQADARRVGIELDRLAFAGRARTANGVVSTAPVRLGTVRFGELVDTNVPAQVNGGELGVSLLGMAYLNRFGRIEISGERMLLHR